MIEKRRILLVDDEADITEFLEFNFQQEGYEVKIADNGRKAVEMAEEFLPHLILMDIMMPEMDGVEACREIKQNPATNDPLICLFSARNEDFSQIAGFEAGADDYVVKPISPKLLIARTNVLMRRKYESASATVMDKSGDQITINREYYTVFKNRKEITLPRKEFEILSLMASKPNRLFRRDEIFSHIWGTDAFVGDRTMDVYIRKIRSKIGDDHIKTVKGVGYKFVQQ